MKFTTIITEELHCFFFNKGRIDCDESHFTYPTGKECANYQDKNFKPVFDVNFTDKDEEDKANDLCKTAPTNATRQFCIFDYFVTGDPEVAKATLRAGIAAQKLQTALSVFSYFNSSSNDVTTFWQERPPPLLSVQSIT